MEARAEFRQPRISKGLVAVVAVSIALGLGVMAGTVAKSNGSAATTQTHSISQGQGGSALQSVRHSGMQAVEENAAVSTSVGPDDRAATSTSLAPIAGRSGPQGRPEDGQRLRRAGRSGPQHGSAEVLRAGRSRIPRGLRRSPRATRYPSGAIQ